MSSPKDPIKRKEWIRKLSEAKKGKKRLPCSEETKKKISESHKGKKSKLKGRTYIEIHGKEKARELKELRRKNLLGKKRPDLTGENNPNYGKVGYWKNKNHSEEAKQKIRISKIAEKNPNWIGGSSGWWAREMKKIYKECVLCKSEKYLEMHHKDNDRENNDRSNRIIICVICHIFWHRH